VFLGRKATELASIKQIADGAAAVAFEVILSTLM
jgi:hypothetical protein